MTFGQHILLSGTNKMQTRRRVKGRVLLDTSIGGGEGVNNEKSFFTQVQTEKHSCRCPGVRPRRGSPKKASTAKLRCWRVGGDFRVFRKEEVLQGGRCAVEGFIASQSVKRGPLKKRRMKRGYRKDFEGGKKAPRERLKGKKIIENKSIHINRGIGEGDAERVDSCGRYQRVDIKASVESGTEKSGKTVHQIGIA